MHFGSNIVTTLFLVLFISTLHSQNTRSGTIKIGDSKITFSEATEEKETWWQRHKITPTFGMQLWSSYTMGAELYYPSESDFAPIDDRVSFQLRRSRIGIKGEFVPRLKFKFTLAADFVGGDVYSGHENAANNGPSPFVRVWNFWTQWQALKGKEDLYITFGYLPPKIGRESMTPALASVSMEKAWSQNYLRRQLVGIGPGRALGINIGGLKNYGERFQLEYDLGVFNHAINNNGNSTVGQNASPLTTARLAFIFGDPEAPGYTLRKKHNYFGQRNGVSVGLAGAYSGTNDNYKENIVLSVDWLANWGPLGIDGDVSYLSRQRVTGESTAEALTGYVRAFYLIPFESFSLAPAVSYVWMQGEDGISGQSVANEVEMASGSESIIEASLNFYFSKKIKLSLAYTLRSANSGSLSEVFGVNNYYRAENHIIRRGDWIGIGLVASL